MKLLLTSAGIKNMSIHDALVDLLGKPISESSALFIPTGIYPFRGGADMARQLVLAANEQAEKGREIVNDAMEAMRGISTSSRKMAEIISVIDEIAFQTNLLNFTASIPAFSRD